MNEDVAALITALIASGTPADLVGRVAKALSEREVVTVTLRDEAADRRREADRKRKEIVRRNLTTSAESADNSPLSERPSEPSSTTLEVNQNSPPYSPPKFEKLQAKPKRPKRAYSDAFERFWSGYPTDPNMSKPEAAEEFDRLDTDDQARCISAAGPFSAYCAKNPDYRPVHAVRFIRQRRFDGFAQSHAPPPGVPTFETDEDHAKWWEQQMLSRAAQ